MHHTVCISSPVPKEPVDRVDCGVDDRQLGYSWGLFLVISKKKKSTPSVSSTKIDSQVCLKEICRSVTLFSDED
jgi:hypothetical protein